MTSSVLETEEGLSSVLIQLIVIILCARAAGASAAAMRQSRAFGEIAAGLLLGPSFFGASFPDLAPRGTADAR